MSVLQLHYKDTTDEIDKALRKLDGVSHTIKENYILLIIWNKIFKPISEGG